MSGLSERDVKALAEGLRSLMTPPAPGLPPRGLSFEEAANALAPVVTAIRDEAKAEALREAAEPCVTTPDGWCATHSTGAGPVYCVAADGQANDCRHLSASGVDTTPISDLAKVWRCDHCGLRWIGGDQ